MSPQNITKEKFEKAMISLYHEGIPHVKRQIVREAFREALQDAEPGGGGIFGGRPRPGISPDEATSTLEALRDGNHHIYSKHFEPHEIEKIRGVLEKHF